MRINDIENWALTIIDSVKAKQPVEDSRVELKAKYPDDVKKAARRIAGHANAARGDHILWLIGVDEAAGSVPGASLTDLSSWFSGVKAEFDELAPELVSVNVPVDDVTVIALYFETDRAPFVVKNPLGGTVQREVPWREATSIKSATRSQLIRLLTPTQNLPIVEVVACLCKLSSWDDIGGQEYLSFDTFIGLFLTQPSSQETVFPSHRCELLYNIPNVKTVPVKGGIEFYGVGASNVNATESSVSVRGSGSFEARRKVSSKADGAGTIVQNNSLYAKGLEIGLTLYSAEAERSLSLDIKLKQQTAYDGKMRQWSLPSWYSFIAHPKR